jgi:transposase, IS30 family
MSYSHLSTFERGKIEVLFQQGFSTRAIATLLGRHHSTIARERKRNGLHYQAFEAQQAYQQRRQASRPRGKYREDLRHHIEERLWLTWSPEQIAANLGSISFKTVYRWLYQGRILDGRLHVLRQKGKRRAPAETRGRFNVGTSLHKRPKDVRKRTEAGHWELDTVVSGRGKSKGCVATFIERKTRYYVAIQMADRCAASMQAAFRLLCSSLPTTAVKSATTDRGKEFACYRHLEQEHGIVVYFADPYASWQRGSNENANGLLREFFPKGTNFATISQEQISQAVDLINQRPRKCLNWKSAYETFLAEFGQVSHFA